MKVTIANKEYEVAQEWNALTGEQLLQVMQVLFVKQYSEAQKLLKLFQVLFRLSDYQFFRMKPEDIGEYLYLVSFFFGELTLTKNLVYAHTFKSWAGTQTFYGPMDGLRNLVMEEFVFSEDYFMRWSENKNDTKLLDELVGVLYRPAKEAYDFQRDPDGDPRVPFNENVCTFHAKQFIGRWPHKLKLAIAYWYAGCRQQLMEAYPDVYGGGGEAAKYGLLSTMLSVAEAGALGDFSKVEKLNVDLVLMTLSDTIDKAKKLESKTP